mgnify:CR=1 FL=1
MLPKLDNPTYELELPSTGEIVKYRPFLVKEQKVLMLAMESEKANQMKETMAQLISTCTFEQIDPYKVPMFDIEYMFLQIRGKSAGETVELSVICPDDEKTSTTIKINLSEVGVQMKNEHTNEIEVTDSIKIIMRYPSLNDYSTLDTDQGNAQALFSMLDNCIEEIHEGDKIHHKVDISEGELTEFIDSLPSDVMEKIGEFFESMPKLQHVVKVKNPKTKKTRELKVEGLQSFLV